METSPRYYELLEAMPRPGCPICRVILHNRDRYMKAMLYEYVNKIETHRAFRAARGLCNDHLTRLQSMPGNVLGISFLMQAVMDEVSSIRDHTSKQNPLQRLLKQPQGTDYADNLDPTGPCIICQQMDEVEASYLDVLKIYYGDKMLDGLRGSPGGLCLPHFRMALRHLPDSTQLVTIQQAHWQRLNLELAQLIERINFEEGKARDLNHHQEDDSWRRAIRYTVGEPEVFGMRRRASGGTV